MTAPCLRAQLLPTPLQYGLVLDPLLKTPLIGPPGGAHGSSCRVRLVSACPPLGVVPWFVWGDGRGLPCTGSRHGCRPGLGTAAHHILQDVLGTNIVFEKCEQRRAYAA